LDSTDLHINDMVGCRKNGNGSTEGEEIVENLSNKHLIQDALHHAIRSEIVYGHTHGGGGG
jgi:hypothetical protein